MASTLAPLVRSEFAKRLKVIRAQRGFPRARYFASTLGIEENRYTRYERAEVEPSLTLIHKICETLRITPNELLGFDPVGHPTGQGLGFAEGEAAPKDEGKTEGKDAIAWGLAAEIVALRREYEPARKPPDPLADLKDIGALYRSLLAEPFEMVARLADEPSLAAVNARRRADIANLMSKLTTALQGQRR